LYVALGDNKYANIGLAQAAAIPASLPPYLVNWGRLIGRVIVKNAAAAFYSVESVFSSSFTLSAVTDHESLGGLLGGASLDHYHLTAAQHTDLTDGGDTTLHDHDGISENTAARHTQGTDTALGAQAEDLDMNSHQITALSVPDAAGEAIRQTAKITEVALEALVDGGGITQAEVIMWAIVFGS